MIDANSGDAHTGEGMDRKIIKKNNLPKMTFFGLIALGAMVGIYLIADSLMVGRTFRVEESRLVISTVTSGVFEDYILSLIHI